LIRPVLLYGSETLVWTKREEKQLLVFERKVLRTICGSKIENGVYTRRYNHELDKEFNSPNARMCHEDKQIALPWSHDQKTRRPTTKSSIQPNPMEGEIKKD
jgi:predicted lipase